MTLTKIDGVVEAVRYTPGGTLSVVRAYERRGAVWSDCLLLERNELVERLKKGLHFVTGERKPYLGSVFTTGPAIQYINDYIVAGNQAAKRDLLVGVSIF